MTESRLAYLFERYINKLTDDQEEAELMELVSRPENKETLQVLLDQFIHKTPPSLQPERDAREEIIQSIFEVSQPAKVVPMKTIQRKWYAAAAVIIAVMAIGGYFLLNQNNNKPIAQQEIKKDIPPGRDGAILTLAGGKKIILDDAQDGKISDAAVKDGNKVSYEGANTATVEYNTMTTPNGRQFSLVLADGTQVWLNASSSITYPTAFIGNDRKVQITGEAYFEVAKDKSKPFHVTVNGMEVQVLGTHFNINSYNDEASIKTTLLEGSVRVSAGDKKQLIKPGQQTQVTNNNIRLIPDPDVDAVMAWKNGFFSFRNTGIREMMRQLSRWYDVEVIYQGDPKDIFTGEIDRNLSLSQVLKVLADTKVRYRIEGNNKLIILP